MEKNKSRNSNIEILRILAMIAIILHHTFVHSYIKTLSDNINYIILDIIQLLGTVANNIFVIITGYYMVNKKIKKNQLIKLIFEVLFYSYLILIIYMLVTQEKDINIIVKSIIPISSNSEWFITAYLLLYISIPFINLLIKNINKKQFSGIIIFGVLCFSVLPTITLLCEYFSCYIWFILLYLIGAYLKLYNNMEMIEKNKLILSISVITLLLFKFLTRNNNKFVIGNINNFMIFMLSVSIFISFIKKKEWHNNSVNYIAASSLGIYLIHDNLILRPIIWKKVNLGAYIETPYFWIYELGVVLFIFCACLIVDKIRQEFIEKPVLTFIYNKVDKIKEKKKLNNEKITVNN